VKETLRAKAYLRYMDDTLFFGPDLATLGVWHDAVRAEVEGPLKLELKPSATRKGGVEHGLPFLGFRVWPQQIRLDRRGARRLARKLRALHREVAAGRLSEADRPGW